MALDFAPLGLSSYRRILVVDDDLDFAEGLDILLTTEGHELTIAHSAYAALEAVNSIQIDVALIDIRLADSCGLNLIQRFRELQPDILCIAMTAFASMDTVMEALHQGAYDYLRKPIHGEDLNATLHRCFQKIDLLRDKIEAEKSLRQQNQELEQFNLRLRQLVDCMQELTRCTNLQELCPLFLQHVATCASAEGGSIYLLEGDELVLAHSLDPGHAADRIPVPPKKNSVFDQVIKTTSPVLVSKTKDIHSLSLAPNGWSGYRNCSLLAYALLGDQGEIIGALSLHNKKQTHPMFTQQDRDIALLLVAFGCEAIRAVKGLENLERSAAQFRSISENMPTPLLISQGTDDIIRYANPRAEETLRFSSNRPSEQSLASLFPDQREWEAIKERLHSQGHIDSFEQEITRADGTSMSALCTLQMTTFEGEPAALTGIYDITSHKVTEEQLRQAQKMEAIGQLSAGISHDFNNLLAIVQGNFEVLGEELDIPHDHQGLFDDAIAAVRRGSDLTKRLLAFGRRQTLNPIDTDVTELVAGMTQLLRRTLRESIQIETRLSDSLENTQIDKGQLESSLLNLALNARDSMPISGTLTIETTNIAVEPKDVEWFGVLQPGRYVMLAVTDTGCGMSKDIQDQAFEPFFTTKDVGHGSGLGLSMIYGFVNQSGGHVRLSSELGQGTRVEIYLPAIVQTEAPTQSPAPASQQPIATGEIILVVEDEPDLRKLVATQLSRLGYRVETAEDAAGALSILDRTDEIDLLFTDAILPGGTSGWALAEKALTLRPKLKILFTSGYSQGVSAEIGTANSNWRLLSKPYQQSELAATVRDVLDEATPKVTDEKKLLVVDDEPAFCRYVQEVAEKLGYSVVTAGSVSEFREAYATSRPSIVLLDIVMPECDGIELVRWLSDQQCEAKVIIVSGYNAHYAEMAMALGAARGLDSEVCLSKPIGLQELREALRTDTVLP